MCVKNWGSFARVVCAPNHLTISPVSAFKCLYQSGFLIASRRIVMSLRWCKHGGYYPTAIMTLTEAAGLVHVSSALVYHEVFSSCTYLVHLPCSVTPGNSCFSLHHCPFPALWCHESCIQDAGQIHLIVHTHVPSTWRAGDRCVVLPLLWSTTSSVCYLQDQIPHIYERVYMPENIPLLPPKA